MTRVWLLSLTALVCASTAWGQTPQPLLCDLTRVLHKPGDVTTKDNKKVPAGTVELVDGQFGKACKFTLVESTAPQFFTAWVNPKGEWDQFDGFSFWVKGDGSKNCGGLEFIDGEDFGQRYGYCFPIQSKDWVKVTVPWSDLVPELSSPPVDARQGYAPSRFRNVWVGKWFYWREHPACSFTLERMALEKHIDRDMTDYRPKQPGLPRLLAKLKAHQPVTIVTMGDSLTDKHHWANRERIWAEELVAQLKKAYGSEVTLVNPAIGGTTLSQNVILMPRWLQEAPSPDLVVIWFGGNDWDSGVRGERYQQYLEMAIDRVRRATKGQAEVLVMTTCPGFAAWETRNELCRAAFEVARERKTGFVDAAGAFHKAGSREEALKRQYWVWDNVHLGPAGHKLIADTVFQAIASGGAGDLTAAAGASWMKSAIVHHPANGETPLSSFEPGQEDLVDHGAGRVVKEHASDGEHSLCLVSKEKDYPGFSLQDGRTLQLLHENSRVLVDVFNPQDKNVDLQLLVRDPQATNYNLRFNGSVTVKPGMNTIDVDYTKLPREATKKNDKPEYLNARQLTLFAFFLVQDDNAKPLTLYFDNVRLARQPTGRIESRPAGTAAPKGRPAPKKAEVRPAGVELLSSFEPDGPNLVEGDGAVVAEHATDGRNALRVQSDGKSYMGLRIIDGRALRKFKDYVLLKVDVFNPQDEPVRCGARIDDAASKDYGSRYNDDGVVIRPGKSTFEINLTGLTKSNARNFADRKKINLATVRLMTLCIGPIGKPLTLFFDNVRLEGSGLPAVEGLRAIGFGPPGAAVYPAFEGCTQQVSYRDDRGYGWIGGDYAMIAYMPDALTGNCASGREFRLKLPNGHYEANLCWDMFGLWGTLPAFHWRKLLVNGQEVLSERRSGADFLAKQYYAHEDDEDLPGQDLWQKYIASFQKIHRFTATVSDGLLRVVPQADTPPGRGICFLVVYPENRLAEGRNFMETLNARRKAQFNAEMVVSVPKANGEQPVASAKDRDRGFIPFVAHTEDDVAVNARPPQEIGKALVIAAARGERQAAQMGLYPLARLDGVKVMVDDLIGTNTEANSPPPIPAAAVQVRKVRNFLKGEGHSRMGHLLPYILQDFQTLDLRPGVTRALWLTITVPPSALPGIYTGSLRIVAGNKSTTIPIKLTVHPFTLDKVADLTISVTGSTPGTFMSAYPELEDRWWQIAEQVMKDQAEHGMNAITGGPGAVLRGVAGGKADIDYTRIDRWMALAVKYGLTMPGDSYQGLDLSGLPNDLGPDCVARCEAAAREKFGVSYEELLRIVYGDLDEHARQKGWPRRVYYFLDEPRPEYGNVQSCGEMIKIRTRACPGTLFSGYYSTGGGRDAYFETMPVSIAHIDKLSLKLVAKGGRQIWDYSGDRVRHDIGRWAFVAAKAGMKGFLRNGYMYVCSQPYFDYSDDESSWAVVYPSAHGLSDTVGWERTAQGVNDYRYLHTCDRLIEKARRSGKGAAAADAARGFLEKTLLPIVIDDKESARLSPRQYDEFRDALAGHVATLKRACLP